VETQTPIFWHQGLFLQPQHFQYSELHLQALLHPFNTCLQPYFWGVAKLEISQGALGSLHFDVTCGEFLFLDGTYASFPGNALLKARSFEKSWTDRDRPLRVFLGLKKYDFNVANVSVLSDYNQVAGATTRYVTHAEPEEVADLYSSGPMGQMQRLHLALKIFWESELEQAGDYLLIPLAQVEMQGAEIQLKRNYIPPSLTLQKCPPLLGIIKDIRDLLASRSRQLEEYKTQRGIHTADFGSRDMVFLLALRSLNRYVPLLFHFTEGGDVHPWTAYGLLRQLVGELSTFSPQYNALGESHADALSLKPYDHKDLGSCFAGAQTIITTLLDEITAGPEYILPLVSDGTYYTVELPPTIFEGRNRFYLVVTSEAEPTAMVNALKGIAKLASRTALPLLIARALPGIGLEHLPIPPQELPRRSHCLYFRINHHTDEWLRVQQAKNLALYWDEAPEDFKVELMIVGRD